MLDILVRERLFLDTRMFPMARGEEEKKSVLVSNLFPRVLTVRAAVSRSCFRSHGHRLYLVRVPIEYVFYIVEPQQCVACQRKRTPRAKAHALAETRACIRSNDSETGEGGREKRMNEKKKTRLIGPLSLLLRSLVFISV